MTKKTSVTDKIEDIQKSQRKLNLLLKEKGITSSITYDLLYELPIPSVSEAEQSEITALIDELDTQIEEVQPFIDKPILELEFLLCEANYLFEIQDAQRAQKKYSQILQYDPENYKVQLNLGKSLFYLDDWDAALQTFEQVHTSFKKNSDQIGIATALNEIGHVYMAQGAYKRARQHYQDALELLEKLEHQSGIAATLCHLGMAYLHITTIDSSENQKQESLDLQVMVEQEQFRLQKVKERREKAMEFFQEALKIAKQQKLKHIEAEALMQIAGIFTRLNDPQKALMYVHESLKLIKQLPDKLGLVVVLNNIGSLYRTMENYEQAHQYYNEGLELAKQLNKRNFIAALLNEIGITYFQQNNFEKAIPFFKEALQIRIELRDKFGEKQELLNLGTLYEQLNRKEQAIEYYRKALLIAEELGENTIELLLRLNQLR